MSTKDFWKGAGERCGKTFLQVGVATLGISATATYTGAQAMALPWETALVTATLSALLSLVTSILNPSFTAGTGGAIEPLPTVPDVEPEDGYAVPEFDADSGEEPRHAEAEAGV
ncbi:hypothetical protein PACID_15320 [Acidipropionibacterium acidipropionici ATCC 4875]|uniref:Holin n=1 Tax=Acidipropionibacterium acidipropionici (strain ATCC 4875 / DSM 20272 / JCM 6432 / NBRC 12425 / NCIMB 8070 / 4) TaxID=1171373 RepID=K7SJB1_ACIA4|nr:holin [Acidipropionibacterium acidipropionici]AFV89345.1 hypothetical protein PACID_15320 [Acidipropionibacterium acidipropionici ATCC 4875]